LEKEQRSERSEVEAGHDPEYREHQPANHCPSFPFLIVLFFMAISFQPQLLDCGPSCTWPASQPTNDEAVTIMIPNKPVMLP
jgi:hypothetical protein